MLYFPCHSHDFVRCKEQGRWVFTQSFKTQLDLRGRKHLEFLPPVDASTWRSKIASGLMFQDAWRHDVTESFDDIQRRTAPLGNFQEVRVVTLSAGHMAQYGASAASSSAGVPWTLMPEPMLPVALADGAQTRIDSLLGELSNLVHFNWGRTEVAKARILELAQGINQAMTFKATQERRTNSDPATCLHLPRTESAVARRNTASCVCVAVCRMPHVVDVDTCCEPCCELNRWAP